MTQLIIIAGYLTLLLGLGLTASRLMRGTSRDYLLASHSIGPFLLLMSLFGTTMTAFALVGSTGEAFREGVGVYGMLASSSGIIHSLCFFVIGVKLWSLGRKYGYTTQISFFRDRLENDGIGLLLFPLLVGLVIPYLLIGVISAGAVINGVTQGRQVVEARDADGTILEASIEEPTFEEGTFPRFFEHGAQGYAIDGSKGGVPKHLASAAICLVVLTYVFFGGMRGTAWANAFQTLVFMILGIITFAVLANRLGGQESLLANLRTIGEQIPRDKLTREHIPKLMFFTYMLIPFSVAMFPHLFQHWLTARSAATFKLPIVAHPIFIMIVWVPCVLIGVWATTDLAAVPPGVRPNAVLAYLVQAKAGPVLGGFLTAGILAAIMSSLDSQFLCLGTIFSNDVVIHYGGKERFNDRQRILLARGFIVLIVAVTYLFSLGEPRRVFQMGVWCFSGFSALFPLVLAALYWRRLTAAGAAASVITVIVSWGYLFYKSDFGKIPNYSVDVTLGGTTYQTMPVATMVLLSTLALVVVSLLTRPPSEATLRKFFS